MKTAANTLVFLVFVFSLTLILGSCSTNKASVNCPDLHKSRSSAFTFNKSSHHQQKNNRITTAENNPASAVYSEQKVVEPIPVEGMATLSNDLPDLRKHPTEIFKILTNEERTQVKQEVSQIFSKTPLLKKMAEKRIDKLSKKYPAPTVSSSAPGSGGLSSTDILAIIAIATCVFVPIAPIVLGAIVLKKIKKGEESHPWAKTLAIVAIAVHAGLILLSIIVSIVVLTAI